MGKETLAIPDEYLQEVISVIRAGIHETKPDRDVEDFLHEWCDEMDHDSGGDDWKDIFLWSN